ncbi:MAG: hypothetical protein IIU38_05910 [Bacteroidaceae bacterium]|nr:hypothetical protein [Bacteroidales bacterium]MBQ5351709.1 hypothetical protein [Bacteroidaceae bacterium]
MKPLEAVSKVVKIGNSDQRIFVFWSDLRNIPRMIPPNADAQVNATEDSCTVTAKGMTFVVKILEKEEYKLIKLGTEEGTKMGFTAWLQLKSLSEYETAARITIHADVPLLMRPMLKGKLTEGINRLADALKMIPY